MKTVYIIYFDDYGEYEVAATAEGEMLDIWSCNDANWRGEYLNPFMKKLGIIVKDRAPARIIEKMRKFRIKCWGGE